MHHETDPHAIRRRRILFRATHRGTYENDILVGGFVRTRLHAFTPREMDALETLMETPDAVLADWLTGRAPIPPADDSPMLRAIRAAAEAGEGRPQGAPEVAPKGTPKGAPKGAPT